MRSARNRRTRRYKPLSNESTLVKSKWDAPFFAEAPHRSPQPPDQA